MALQRVALSVELIDGNVHLVAGIVDNHSAIIILKSRVGRNERRSAQVQNRQKESDDASNFFHCLSVFTD